MSEGRARVLGRGENAGRGSSGRAGAPLFVGGEDAESRGAVYSEVAASGGMTSTEELMMRCPPVAKLMTNPILLMQLLVFFLISFVGATVTGTLARRRRKQLAVINKKLILVRRILQEQSAGVGVTEADRESGLTPRAIVENGGIAGPAMANASESVARASVMLKSVGQGREGASKAWEAETLLREARGVYGALGNEEEKLAGERDCTRLISSALRLQGKLEQSRDALLVSAATSRAMGGEAEAAEDYGELADPCVEMGQMDDAAMYYDKYIASIS